MTDVAGVEGARRTEIPWQLRGAWWFELLFLPVAVLSLLVLPLDDWRAWLIVGAQVAITVAVAVGLRRRSLIAWIAAMALACYFIYRTLANARDVARQVLGVGGDDVVLPVVMLAWAFLTQLGVLLFCLAMFWGGRWRRELD